MTDEARARTYAAFVGIGATLLGFVGGSFGAGRSIGKAEERITVIESCISQMADLIEERNCDHEERLRAVEQAVAVLPEMADDIDTIQGQVQDLVNYLLTDVQPRD